MNGTSWSRKISIGILALLPMSLIGADSEEWLESLLAKRLFDQLFDTTLPGLYNEGDWGIRFRPKLGDVRDDDYIRLIGGVRYSFSNYFDAYVDLGTYVMNPTQSGTGSGLYAWAFGGRYTWYNVGESGNDVAAGINSEIPISDPPIEITDRYARYNPYVTISHQFRNYPNWRIYLNASYQLVDNAQTHLDPESPQPRDRLFLKPGVIFFDGGKFRYSMELEYRSNALHFRGSESVPIGYDGPSDDVFRPENWILAYEDVHEVIAYPGITWFPSKKVREGFLLPGSWDVGLRLKLPLIEETGQNFGVSVRFRWHYDYSKYIRKELRNLIGRL